MTRWLTAGIVFIPLLTSSACQALLVLESSSNADVGDAADESARDVIEASAEGASMGDAIALGDGSANDASVPADASQIADAGSFCKTAVGTSYCADFENGPDAASYGFNVVVTNQSSATVVYGTDGSNVLILHRSQAGISSADISLSSLGTTRIFEGYFACSGAANSYEFQASFLLSNGDRVGIVCQSGRQLQGFYLFANGAAFAATAHSVASPAWVRVVVDPTSAMASIDNESISMPTAAPGDLEPAKFVLGHPEQKDDDAVTMTFDNLILRP